MKVGQALGLGQEQHGRRQVYKFSYPNASTSGNTLQSSSTWLVDDKLASSAERYTYTRQRMHSPQELTIKCKNRARRYFFLTDLIYGISARRLMETGFAFKNTLTKWRVAQHGRRKLETPHTSCRRPAACGLWNCETDGTGSIVECANKCEKAVAARHFVQCVQEINYKQRGMCCAPVSADKSLLSVVLRLVIRSCSELSCHPFWTVSVAVILPAAESCLSPRIQEVYGSSAPHDCVGYRQIRYTHSFEKYYILFSGPQLPVL